MKYDSLKKLFHIDEKEQKKRYEARFSSEAAIQLPFDIQGNQAFVFLTPSLVKLCEKILQANAQLNRLSQNLPCTKLIFVDALFREIENSNEIEGIHSSRQQLNEALHAKTPIHFTNTVHKYLRLISASKDPFPQTAADIRRIYDQLLINDVDTGDWPDGELFRKKPVYVVGAQKPVHTGLYPEEQIIETLNNLLEVMKDDEIPDLVKVGIFHFIFGYIHPFYDGNGRLNRYLSTLFLSEKTGVAASLQLSVTLRAKRSKYYRMFELCEDPLNKGDLTPFIIFFMETFLESLLRENAVLETKSRQYADYEQMINELDPNETDHHFLSQLAQGALFTTDGFTKKELAEELNCSQATINKLVTKYSRLIHVTRQGRFFHYMLNDLNEKRLEA